MFDRAALREIVQEKFDSACEEIEDADEMESFAKGYWRGVQDLVRTVRSIGTDDKDLHDRDLAEEFSKRKH